MTINVFNPYIEKLATISIPLAEAIDPLMERGMSIDEVGEHLKLALIALDSEQVRKGKKSVNQVREEQGFEPVPDAYLEGIMNREVRFTW